MSDVCNLPPAGWTCSREAGHDGPCAATVETTGYMLPSVGCSRCAGQHDEVPLYWRPFWYAIPADDGSEPWTHWATCPVTGDPILMRVTD